MASMLTRVTAVLGAVGLAGSPQVAAQNFDTVQVETRPIQGNVYMLVGAGGNVTVQTGNDGVLAAIWRSSCETAFRT